MQAAFKKHHGLQCGFCTPVGAMTRHAAVAADERARARFPALARLAGGIGDVQVRNLGTTGGSVANNDPAADYPAALLGLGASVRTDPGEHAADGVFTDLFETSQSADFSPDAIQDIALDAAGLNTDIHASAAYRAHLVGVMARRAVAVCARPPVPRRFQPIGLDRAQL